MDCHFWIAVSLLLLCALAYGWQGLSNLVSQVLNGLGWWDN